MLLLLRSRFSFAHSRCPSLVRSPARRMEREREGFPVTALREMVRRKALSSLVLPLELWLSQCLFLPPVCP
eukprot:SAG22_NODE_993_length_6123_cov_15.091799_9_plen_71_part_00